MTTTIPRPNKDAVNSALDIYRDAMRPFIAEPLGIDPGSIDINDFPNLIERHWDNVFEQYFRRDRYVPDKLRIIVEGRNAAAHPGLQDMELRHATTYLTLISDMLELIGRSDEGRDVESLRVDILNRPTSLPPSNLNETLATMIDQLDSAALAGTSVIPWASPVPSFGDTRSRLATLGLNPSPLEFVDDYRYRTPLRGHYRRLHTLESLGLASWSDAEDRHIKQIWDACRSYFSNNPYDRWFKPLDDLISDSGFSYYAPLASACHFDLVPFATYDTWSRLSYEQQTRLRRASADTLGQLLRDSSVRILILNGRSVINEFQSTADCRLRENYLRVSTARVYQGVIDTLSSIPLGREVHILGFSAYIQRASHQDTTAIKQWLTQTIVDLNLP